jgi:hypothetical protein
MEKTAARMSGEHNFFSSEVQTLIALQLRIQTKQRKIHAPQYKLFGLSFG